MRHEPDLRNEVVLAAEKDAFALLAGGHDLPSTLDFLLTKTEHLCDHGLLASVWLVTQEGRPLSFCAGPRVPKAYREAVEAGVVTSDLGCCRQAIQTRRPAVVPDWSATPLWADDGSLLASLRIRASCSIPILSPVDEVLGTVAAYYPEPCRPSQEDLQLLDRIACTTGLLIERHRTDQALRQSREQLQLLTDTVPALISYVDRDARYRFCNRRYAEWFGLPAADIVGRPVEEVLGEKAWKEIGPRIQAALGGEVVEYEAEIPYSHGGVRWIHAVYTPHRDGQGQVIGLVVMVTDITARKHEQLALAHSEERFRRLVEVSAGMVWTTDETGTPREDSPSWRAFTGFRRDHYLNSWAWLDAYHPDDRTRLAETWQAALQERTPYALEARLRQSDGQYRQTLLRALPLFREDGTVREWVGMSTDITQHKEAEAALSESERMLREATDAAQAVVWDMDLKTGFVTCRGKAQSLWGLTEGSAEAFFNLVHPDDRDLVRSHGAEAIQSGGTYSLEYRVLDPLGQVRWLYSRGNVLNGPGGQPARFIGVSVDITERKRAEAVVQANEDVLQRVFHAASVGMCLIDENMRFQMVNRRFADIFEYSPEQMVGMDARTLLPAEQRQEAEGIYHARLQGNEDSRIWEVATKRGSRRVLHSNATRVFQTSGRPLLLGVVQDITEQVQTEAAVHESRERYANLVNSIDGIVWEVDARTMRFTFVSLQAERLLGYPLESWYGETFWCDHIHPDDRDYAVQYCLDETRAKRDHIFEYRMVAADGRVIWLRDIISVIVEHDAPKLLRGVMVDITEHKEAEAKIAALHAEVRRALEEMQTLMHVLPVGIFVARDRTCSTITMNAAGAAMLGLPEGTNASKTGPNADQLPFRVLQDGREVPPEELPIQRAARTGMPVIGEEMDVVLHDGTVTNLYEYAVPLFAEGGEVRGCVGVFIDITERKRAEEALRLSEQRFRLATAAGKVGIWEWDIRANAVTWTDSLYQIHGLTPGAVPLTAEGFDALVHPDDRRRVSVAKEAALRTDAPYEMEFRALRPDGEVIWLFTNAVVLRELGAPVRMIGATVDITSSKRAAEQLRSWNAELERRVGERTGELEQSQQRLRALATELNLAEQREHKRLAAELHDHLAQMLVLGRLKLGQAKRMFTIDHQCLALLQQADEVLAQSLAYTRTLVAELSPPVLHEFGLAAGLKWLGEQMKRYDLSVEVELQEGARPVLPEDQTMLVFQSVRELLMNTAKHAQTSRAMLRLDEQQGHLRVIVQDRGVGFDVAVATDKPSAPTFGLFSIRERMKALGGSFEIQSQLGEGTRATLTLPVAVCRPEPSGEQETPDQGQPSVRTASVRRFSRHLRVLLVDDHAMMRQGLRNMLEDYADVEVVGEASDGDEAVEQVERLQPSVVVMDINMPKTSGIEATARIKARHPEILVVGLSVNAAGDNQEAMRAAGASRLLTKEAAVEQLYETIQEAIRELRHS